MRLWSGIALSIGEARRVRRRFGDVCIGLDRGSGFAVELEVLPRCGCGAGSPCRSAKRGEYAAASVTFASALIEAPASLSNSKCFHDAAVERDRLVDRRSASSTPPLR